MLVLYVGLWVFAQQLLQISEKQARCVFPVVSVWWASCLPCPPWLAAIVFMESQTVLFLGRGRSHGRCVQSTCFLAAVV